MLCLNSLLIKANGIYFGPGLSNAIFQKVLLFGEIQIRTGPDCSELAEGSEAKPSRRIDTVFFGHGFTRIDTVFK